MRVELPDRPFWPVFLTIVIIGIIAWLVTFKHSNHPRIYRYNEETRRRRRF